MTIKTIIRSNIYLCSVLFVFILLHSCGESKFAQWGNKKLNELYYKNERQLDDTEYQIRKMEKQEKARKKMERRQQKTVPEGLKKYMDKDQEQETSEK